MADPETDVTSIPGCFIRLFWMFGGIIILAFLSISIFKHRSLSIFDLGFWLVVAGLVLLRFVDIRYLHGQTAEGKPATMDDWRRYSLWLMAIALGGWLILHAIGLLMK